LQKWKSKENRSCQQKIEGMHYVTIFVLTESSCCMCSVAVVTLAAVKTLPVTAVYCFIMVYALEIY
jgi:hypothetical protein